VVPRIVLTDTPPPKTWGAISDGLSTFNETWAGPLDFRLLILMLQDEQTGETNGGLWGRTMYQWLYINILFVPETLRRTGLGTKLIREAEAEAMRRGCMGGLVDTFSFQARPFYERLGYQVVGTVPDYPPGHACFFLSRRFNRPMERR
jgi:GNAT superfamily N-acetyltransferase